MDLQLEGRKVLVSGGSRGIGRAIVELFLAEGAEVAFCARGADGVAAAAVAFGARAYGTALDVTDAAQVAHWATAAGARMGGIDIVVPNVSAAQAGRPGHVGRRRRWRLVARACHRRRYRARSP